MYTLLYIVSLEPSPDSRRQVLRSYRSRIPWNGGVALASSLLPIANVLWMFLQDITVTPANLLESLIDEVYHCKALSNSGHEHLEVRIQTP